jgi:hypothetical protein
MRRAFDSLRVGVTAVAIGMSLVAWLVKEARR